MNRFGSALWVVFLKELVDGFRDRRSLLSTLLFPLLGPLLIGFAFTTVAEREKKVEEVELPVAGAEQAPALISFMEREGVRIVDAPEDPVTAVRDGTVEAVLVIPERFGEAFDAMRPAPVELIYDGTRDESRPTVRRVRGLVEGWSGMTGSLRLIGRGVDPQLANAIALEEVEVASDQQRAAKLLDFLPMFIIMAAFIGSMQIAVDATAGERERSSLEPLLVNPVPRSAIVLGKWGAAVVFAAGAVALTLAGSIAAMSYAPLEELGIHLSFEPAVVLGVLAATLPLGLMAAGLQVLVATFARSFKEAQSYLSLLMLFPIIPSFVASLWELGDAPWMIPVPALGQQVLLGRVLGGETVSFGAFAVAGVSALAVGLVCVFVTARLFRRESIIFGR